MFFELNIKFDHIVDLIFNEVREDDVRLIARGKGISRSCKKIL